MTKIFFEELRLQDPTANLNVGSGTHVQQVAKVMLRQEKTLQKQKTKRSNHARLVRAKKPVG